MANNLTRHCAKKDKQNLDYTPLHIPTYTDRADSYATGRPSYPVHVAALLGKQFGVRAGARVADVGAGTGIFSKLLLDQGYVVDAVEPDGRMGLKAQQSCGCHAGFHLHLAEAEQLPLPDASMAAVTVAQALHWFRAKSAAAEFRRVTRRQGVLLSVWNERRRVGSRFLSALDEFLLERFPAYRTTLSPDLDPIELTLPYSADGDVQTFNFVHTQMLNWEGFSARIFSASFAPPSGSAEYRDLRKSLKTIFLRYAAQSMVEITYDTVATACRLHRS